MPSIRSGSRRPRSAKARNRGKGYVWRCGVRYRELSTARNFDFEAGWFSPAASLECVYNFGVMARGLLNGDLRFRPMCDFKELRVAKIARSTTSAWWTCRQPWGIIGRTDLWGLQQTSTLSNRNRFELLVKMIAASPVACVSSFKFLTMQI